jgi:hypothetical protein
MKKVKFTQSLINDSIIIRSDSFIGWYKIHECVGDRNVFGVQSSDGIDTEANGVFFPTIERAIQYIKKMIINNY